MTRAEVSEAVETLKDADAQSILRWAVSTFDRKRIAIASSLSAEDQVLTDMAVAIDPEVRIFTLDTGRLFPETYELMEATIARYRIKLEVQFPDAQEVESMVKESGPNLFYRSVENRKRCCFVRKVQPLQRVLGGLDAWICGLRRSQSVTRSELAPVEWDEQNGLVKVNPLVDWSENEVWSYVHAHDVPYNALHDKGFPSIGCQPCTRAVRPGDDPRSGRWWWEQPEHKECGLHGSGQTPEKTMPALRVQRVELQG